MYPSVSWCTQVYPDVPNCILMYPSVSWRTQMYPDVPKCTQVYPGVFWCILYSVSCILYQSVPWYKETDFTCLNESPVPGSHLLVLPPDGYRIGGPVIGGYLPGPKQDIYSTPGWISDLWMEMCIWYNYNTLAGTSKYIYDTITLDWMVPVNVYMIQLH